MLVLSNELSSKNQQIVFLNFKQSLQNACLGVNKNIGHLFKNGTLEEVIASSNHLVY